MAAPESENTPVAGCLTRLYWMVGGIVILIFLAYSIANHDFPSVFDAGYWLVVLSLVVIRFVDVRFLRGQTAEGQPATMGDWRRYSFGLVSGSLGVWLILHGINYLL